MFIMDGEGDTPNAGGDKTPESSEIELNDKSLDDIPDEDDSIGDGDKKEPKAGEDESSSAVVQKRKYREKYLKAQEKIRELEKEKERKQKEGLPTTTEDKEAQAQRYIRNLAREEMENFEKEKKIKEEEILEAFQDKLDEVLVDNPDFTEDQVVEICEEYKVEPEIAIKILKRANQPKSKKPSMPSPKRGSSEPKKPKTDDSGKSIFDIAQDAKKRLKDML